MRFKESAVDGQVGLDRSWVRTFISGNSGVGLAVAAPRCRVTNAAIGLHPDGKEAGNRGYAGIYFFDEAVDGRFGTEGSPNRTYSAGNYRSDFEVCAARMHVCNAGFGVTFGAKALANDGRYAHVVYIRVPTAVNVTIGGLGEGANITFISGHDSGSENMQSDIGIVAHAPGLRVGAVWIGFGLDGSPQPNRIGRGIELREDAGDAILGAGLERMFIGNCKTYGLVVASPRTLIHHASVGISPNGERAPMYTTAIKVIDTGHHTTVGMDESPFRTFIDNCCGNPRFPHSYTVIEVNAPHFTLVNAQVGIFLHADPLFDSALDASKYGGSNVHMMELLEGASDARIGVDGSSSSTHIFPYCLGGDAIIVKGPRTIMTNVVVGSGFEGDIATDYVQTFETQLDAEYHCNVWFEYTAASSQIGTDGSPNRTYFSGEGAGLHLQAPNMTMTNFASGFTSDGRPNPMLITQQAIVAWSNVEIGSDTHGNISVIGWTNIGISIYPPRQSERLSGGIQQATGGPTIKNVWIGFDFEGKAAPLAQTGISMHQLSVGITIGNDGKIDYPVYVGNCKTGISNDFALGVQVLNTIIGISPVGEPAPNVYSGITVSHTKYFDADTETSAETKANFMKSLRTYAEDAKTNLPYIMTIGSDGSQTPVVISCNLAAQVHARVAESDQQTLLTEAGLRSIFITNAYIGFGRDGGIIQCPSDTLDYWHNITEQMPGGMGSGDTRAFVELFQDYAVTLNSASRIGTSKGKNKTYVTGIAGMLMILPVSDNPSDTTVITNTIFGQSKDGITVENARTPVISMTKYRIAPFTALNPFEFKNHPIEFGEDNASPNIINYHSDSVANWTTYRPAMIYVNIPRTTIANTIINIGSQNCETYGIHGDESYLHIGPNVVIRNASSSGIVVYGPNLTVINTSVEGSWQSGIWLDETADGAQITESRFVGNGWRYQDKFDRYAAESNEGRGGAIVNAPGSVWSNNTFGDVCEDTTDNPVEMCRSSGNMFYGLWIRPTGTGAVVTGNVVRESAWDGIRDDTEGHRLQSGDSNRAGGANSFNTVDATNGKGLAACEGEQLCLCSSSASEGAKVNGVSVDCSRAFKLGPNFPTRLPINTGLLNLHGVELEAVKWESLASMKPGLVVLDLGDNPLLDGLPASGVFDGASYPQLMAVNLRGTNMSRMTNNSFAGLKDRLETLDLSVPSVAAPADVVLNLTGFKRLRVVLTDRLNCPAGYFDSNPTYGPTFSGIVLCARCDLGTYKPAGRHQCEPCSDATYDNDHDPSTPCTLRLQFSILSYRRGGKVYHNRAQHGTGGGGGMNNESAVLYQLGYRTPITIAGVTILSSAFQTGNVTYGIDQLPDGMLFDPASGHIEGVPLNKLNGLHAVASIRSVLYAVDEAGNKAAVELMDFKILHEDIDNPANGPLGRPCEHFGKAVDEVPFDNHFTCDCTSTEYKGSNCTVRRRLSVWVVLAIVIGALSVLIAFGSVWRVYNARKVRNGPHSFVKMVAQLESKFAASQDTNDARDDGGGVIGSSTGSDGDDEVLLQLDASSFEDDVPMIDLGDNDACATGKRTEAADASGMFWKCLPVFARKTLRRARQIKLAAGSKLPIEISREQLEVLGPMGHGVSGEVLHGLLRPKSGGRSWGRSKRSEDAVSQPCAVKVPKRGSSSDMRSVLLEEAALMAQFQHPNVVALLGIVTRNQQCMMVLELCEKGSLFGLLRREVLHVKKEEAIRSKVVLNIAFDIASGMAYLSGRRFVHRDLAARNVLMDANSRCKVSDFGMSRALMSSKHYYYVRPIEGGVPFPLRWSAPEVLVTGRFTTASDVWSFGVLMYEVLSRGTHPFVGMSNVLVIEALTSNGNAAMMEECFQLPYDAYAPIYKKLVLRCWRHNVDRRHGFSDIVQIAEELLGCCDNEGWTNGWTNRQSVGAHDSLSHAGGSTTDVASWVSSNSDDGGRGRQAHQPLRPTPKSLNAGGGYLVANSSSSSSGGSNGRSSE